MGDDRAPSLEALAARAVEGDRDAFDALARGVHPGLMRLALAKAGSRDDAEELVQRTLVRVYGGLPGFRGDSSVTTWIFRIATNIWIDMERSRRSRRTVEEPLVNEIEQAVAALDEPADERMARQEQVELVRRYFSELAPRQREVLELVDLQGLEPSEAAEALGVTPSTARVHLHRARRTLRSAILERHPEVAEEYLT
ncbi:MAG: RNA polymerase sigma factor [Gemmatimonadetes bacterium]|nr:RNA polymerase sigma factor [Gemmatimonadota bacterium]